MSEFLFQYHKVNPTTWVYLSSLLMIGLYFKFGRFWSVRNFDLMILILLAPGLLLAQYGGEAGVTARRLAMIEHQRLTSGADALAENGAAPTRAQALLRRSREIERLGYLWLFAVGGGLLLRLLLDPTMVRRPLLEPNLTSGGLTFIGCSLFVFLMANVWISEPATLDKLDEAALEQLAESDGAVATGGALRRGPGYPLLNLIPSIPTNPLLPEDGLPGDPGEAAGTHAPTRGQLVVARLIAILCHLSVILGIIAIGYWHFANTKTGIGVATLYLMLPYTAQMTGHIDHVIPAALLVWAILCYRRPLTSGVFIGLATSLIYYPLFLLPLWISFYWQKGLMRFVIGVLATLTAMAIALYFIPQPSYVENLKQMFGLWLPKQEGLEGIWRLGWNPIYRIPVMTAFMAFCGTLAIWPAQKNLGTLLSCSAAVMVAAQFWHGFGGGLYIGWYLPLMLLTIFRPNLEDRVALTVLGEGWPTRRMVNNGYKAA